MRFGMHVRGVVLMFTLAFAWASCSFPSVEYEPACAAPKQCENEANACAKKAAETQDSCAKKCSTSCQECDTDFDRALGMCVAQCESCSASEGCLNATESCKALLGAP